MRTIRPMLFVSIAASGLAACGPAAESPENAAARQAAYEEQIRKADAAWENRSVDQMLEDANAMVAAHGGNLSSSDGGGAPTREPYGNPAPSLQGTIPTSQAPTPQ